jgi:hypothetical protein
MHSNNTCDMYEEFCIGCKNVAENFLFLFTVSLPPTPSCNKRDTTHSYVTCSKVNAKSSQTSSDGTVRNVIR